MVMRPEGWSWWGEVEVPGKGGWLAHRIFAFREKDVFLSRFEWWRRCGVLAWSWDQGVTLAGKGEVEVVPAPRGKEESLEFGGCCSSSWSSTHQTPVSWPRRASKGHVSPSRAHGPKREGTRLSEQHVLREKRRNWRTGFNNGERQLQHRGNRGRTLCWKSCWCCQWTGSTSSSSIDNLTN